MRTDRVWPILLFLLIGLGTPGCQPDPDPVDRGLNDLPLSTTRDSAGTHIVENPRPAEGSRLSWRIGPAPTASIGVLEGEEPYMLHYATDAAKLYDGRIVVANGGDGQLRVFDARGTHLDTWGGEGEGPGEFRSLREVARWPGDSIVAWNAPRMGISVFDLDGNHGRTFRLADDVAWFWPESVATGGSILAVHSPEEADTVVVQIRDGEGRVKSSFGTFPHAEPYILDEGEHARLYWKIFGRRALWVAWGDRIAIGDTRRYEIRVFRADGSLERIVRRDHVPRAPTPADVEADIEARVERNTRSVGSDPEADSYREQRRREYRTVPVAEHFPAFQSIMADAADHLWVEEYEAPTDDFASRLWTVFDPNGQVLGFFETPKDWLIYEIGEDHIVVWTQDELNVETVQVWPLERSESQ